MRLPPEESEQSGPNLTPVIDVVFLLLIFFLVATRFDQEEREVETRLPEVAQARPLTSGQQQIIVNISDKGEYKIAGQTFTSETLAGTLREEALKNHRMQTVLIRCDERAAFKFPAYVMGVCEKAEIKHICAVKMVR